MDKNRWFNQDYHNKAEARDIREEEKEEYNQFIIDEIKKIRKGENKYHEKYSQEKMAEICGIAQGTYSKIENPNETAVFNAVNVRNLEEYFDVSFTQLYRKYKRDSEDSAIVLELNITNKQKMFVYEKLDKYISENAESFHLFFLNLNKVIDEWQFDLLAENDFEFVRAVYTENISIWNYIMEHADVIKNRFGLLDYSRELDKEGRELKFKFGW